MPNMVRTWLPMQRRLPWLLIFLSAASLELAALYFQYGMDLNPCVLCVYQRTAVAAIALGALIGVAVPAVAWIRYLGYLTILAAAVIGYQLALELVAIQSGQTMTCDFMADYPAWARLDEWLPAVFQPTGYCDEEQWHFLGIGMPSWMLVIFGFYAVASALVWVSELIPARR